MIGQQDQDLGGTAAASGTSSDDQIKREVDHSLKDPSGEMPGKVGTSAAAGGASSECRNSSEVKDVIVIGNGPSAISLSYFLHGNSPYYKGGCDIETLDNGLKFLKEELDDTLLLQDYFGVAEGCEGRSHNPVAVFFDTLSRPDADLGVVRSSLLEWENRPDLKVNHLILGKGRPGGCWEAMDGDIQTVSLGNWMELPNLKLSEVVTEAPGKRVNVSSVAHYYQEYVKRKELCRSFVNHAEVTSVKAITQCEVTCTSNQSLSSTSLPAAIPNNSQKKKSYDREPTAEENALFQNEENMEGELELDQMEVSSFPDSASDSNTLASSPSQWDCCSSASSQNYREISLPSREISQEPDLPCALLDYEEERLPNGLAQDNLNERRNPSRGARQAGLLGYSYMDECSSRDGGYEEYTMDPDLSSSLAWDPIVNPELFASKSVGSSSKFGSYNNWNSSSWNDDGAKRCSMQVEQCFPNVSRLFQVRGFKTVKDTYGRLVREDFSYMTKNVVLATGSYDLPNKLTVHGETLPFVLHSLPELEKEIASGLINKDSDPIMIVGAGLSAADAISTAMNEKIPVIHVLRRAVNDPNIVFNKLPKALYPEYHKIYRMMIGDETPGEDEGSYQVLGKTCIIRFNENKEVEISSLDGHRQIVKVGRVVILIGSSPNLNFLDESLRKNLGVMKETPISRNNPVNILRETNEAVNEPGIYAMGPLVGDNFVRFLQGGALAITSDILRKEKKGLGKHQNSSPQT